MTVYVTGANGFLARRMINSLLLDGENVVGITRDTATLSKLSDKYKNFKPVLSEKNSIKRVFESDMAEVRGVVHAATCYESNSVVPLDLINANVVFPLEILDLAIKYKFDYFINCDTFFSSYSGQYQYLESYAQSKGQFVEWGKCVGAHEAIRFINARIFHMYGPFDSPNKFVAKLVYHCIKNIDFEMTEGYNKRDFIYVDDVVHSIIGFIRHHQKIKNGFCSLDIGTGIGTSIRDFAQLVHKLTESKSNLKFGSLNYREGEIVDPIARSNQLEISMLKKPLCVEDGIKRLLDEQVNINNNSRL